MRAAARRFFALPAEVKQRYAARIGGRGWLPPGVEANAAVDADGPDQVCVRGVLPDGRALMTLTVDSAVSVELLTAAAEAIGAAAASAADLRDDA